MDVISQPSRGYFCLAALLLAVSTAHASDDFVDRVVVFGDSLADGGYYSALLDLPPGRSFTTNPDPVAPEVFASELGLSLSPAYGEDGTNFATGGARVAAANPPSIPIAAQIDSFLATEGEFNQNDLVYIQGGGNDFFAFAAGGAVDTTIVTNAAEDLASLVSTVQNAGAPQIVTMAVQTGGNAGLQLFNSSYETALADNNINALYFDADALFNEMVAFADQFGFTNVTDPACSAVDALSCTRADLVAPDANETHILADAVHPAGKAQRLQGQAIASLLIAPEQIGQLSYASQALFRSHRSLNEQTFLSGLNQDVGSNAYFGKLGAYEFQNDGSIQATGVDEDGIALSLGLDHRMAEQTSVGVSMSVSDGEGDFEQGRGDYKVDAISATVYAQGNAGEFHVHTDLMLGRARYEALTRNVQLDSVLRSHEGETDADFFGLGITSSREFSFGNGFSLVPRAGLNYQTLDIDDYSEDTTLSTGAHFGDQELDSLNGAVGLTLRSRVAESIHFYIDGQFNYEFKNDNRTFTITPNGAPISYTSELHEAERDYFSFDVGVDFRVANSLLLQAGANGTTGRGDLERTTFFIGTTIEM